ncbi:MFS transporter [Bifidobacterium vespertilionis]|uniref:MFS transporter n=1 Tax=Bifidobacterium vespertilionis TaxID=2562524 RepID=A0A5J5DTX1_9BIFI|nr:MFS transporter [Bifidobacterium vespertilionis]KAA8819038.1 MFS transporter [Bifidobacterium vespertilionis]KAA8822156.1 MFS transporter [Bifidobacterium vespertilionis]
MSNAQVSTPAAPANSTRNDRFFTPAVVTLIMISFALGMSEFIIVGILPDIATGLNIPLTTAGGLVSLFAFVYAPATPIGAALASRFERFHVIAALMAVFLLGNILCAVAPNYAVLLVARVIIALISGTTVTTSMTFVDDVASPKNRTKFVAWVFSGFSVAAVFGVPVGTAVANALGWRWAFYVIVAMTVVLIAAMFRVLPKNHYGPRSRFLAQFFIFTEPRIWAGIISVVCGAAATYVFYTYLSPILQDEIGMPASMVSIALSAYGLMCLASNLYSGKLGDRGRGTKPLIGVLPIYLVQAVLLALLPFAVMNPIAGCALLLVLGFFMYLQNTPSQILYMDVAAETHPGSLNLASSFNSMAFNIGIAVGSAVGGLVTDTVGMHWLGPFGAIFALLAAGSVLWLKIDDRKRSSGR